MATARHPARQLNSKSIRDAVLTYMIPEVQNRYCIVQCKVVWRVQKDPTILAKAWKLICEKQEECDNAIQDLNSVAFFFSAIASCESKDKFEDPAFPSQETDLLAGHQGATEIAVQKVRYPAINYWLALESPNGAPVSLVPLRRKLLECEVEIDTRMINHVKANLPRDITKALSGVIKDHNSSYMQSIVETSYEFCINEAFAAISSEGEDNSFAVEFQQSRSQENVVRFYIPKPQHWIRLSKVIGFLKRAGLKVQVMDIEENSLTDDVNLATSTRVITLDPTTQLVNDIERIMKTLQYANYKGVIYRKNPKALYTYSQRCTVNEFMGTLEGNELLKGRMVCYGQKIKEKLKQPECQLIHQLEVNYDLIEVNNGWCFSLSSKEFVNNPLSPEDIGQVSPRAFVNYDPAKEPDPKFFREILENSLSEDEIIQFCNDFIGLLQFQKKKHKEKVPCLIGAADSGKTSLFAPLLSIIPPNNIARVTKQRNFNKAMITSQTEVIFIDEAHVNIMDIDDWKLLTQGGWTAHDVKYSTARGFINRCPMLIACQQELEFDEGDEEAMNSRLNKYFFRQLPKKDLSAYTWIKNHPMDAIVWAMEKSTTQPSVNDDDEIIEGLTKEDQAELFECSFEDRESEIDNEDLNLSTQDSQGPTPSSQNNEESPPVELSQTDTPSSQNNIPTVELWENQVRRAFVSEQQNMFRRRLLKTLLEEAQERVQRDKKTAHEIVQTDLKRKRLWLQDLGIPEEESSEVTDPYGELPTSIKNKVETELDKRRQQDDNRKQKEMERRIAKAFAQGSYLRKTELALHENVELLNNKQASDSEKVGAKGMMEISSHKLKSFHEAIGTSKVKEAIEERKRVCMLMGILSKRNQHLVTNLSDPLPIVDESEDEDEEEENEEEEFVTPPCSQDEMILESSRKRKHHPI